ncbi:MAG: hypothetical protein KKE23_02485 [Nanoarchaeota archaeon]|nr:hypothetical protein [Nanoarchaeota archaeon]
MQIKKSAAILGLAILLLVPFASAGFFDFITGKASTQNTNLSIVVNNTFPNVTVVGTTEISSINEETFTSYSFNVSVYDHDGVRDINGTYGVTVVNVNFTNGAETPRHASCLLINSNFSTKTATYNCTVIFWYWDAPGIWNAKASANDSGGAMAYNLTQNLSVPNLFALRIYPTNITWNSSLNPGATNQTASLSTILNNTGNIDFASGSTNYITLNSTNLSGAVNPLQIGANLFSVGNETNPGDIECGFNLLVENQFRNVTSILYSGNLSAGAAQEELSYCLTEVPAYIEKQNYATLNPWTIKLNVVA